MTSVSDTRPLLSTQSRDHAQSLLGTSSTSSHTTPGTALPESTAQNLLTDHESEPVVEKCCDWRAVIDRGNAWRKSLAASVRQAVHKEPASEISIRNIKDLPSALEVRDAFKNIIKHPENNYRTSEREQGEMIDAFAQMVFPYGRSPKSHTMALRESLVSKDIDAINKVVANHPELNGIPIADLLIVRWWTTDFIYPRVMNALLDPISDWKKFKEVLPLVKGLISGLNALPESYRYEGEVHTGEHKLGPEGEQWIDRYRTEDGKLLDWAFLATSKTAKSAWQGGDVKILTRSNTGKCIAVLSVKAEGSDEDEQEVLFPAGTSYRDIHVSEEGSADNRNQRILITQSQDTGDAPANPRDTTT